MRVEKVLLVPKVHKDVTDCRPMSVIVDQPHNFLGIYTWSVVRSRDPALEPAGDVMWTRFVEQ
jgi:hypothetical protein